ncbi:MAG: hypothetical protein AAFZ91_00120 [Pseudomonadota bacterium]
MTLYRDFGEEFPDLPRPESVYARLDTVEPDPLVSEESELVFLDAIHADFIDHENISRRSIEEDMFDELVSILELRGASAWDFVSNRKEPNGSIWFKIVFGQGDVEVLQYLNLFAGGIERRAQARMCDASTSKRLDDLLSLDDYPDADVDDIGIAIDVLGDIGAAVYDVGQGNCNAIVNDQGQPLLYYDFGGGVIGHSSTYRTGLSQFCFSQTPAIVMSHWDWDHWSSALRIRSNTHRAARGPVYSDAMKATWIVPRQNKSLGAVHRGFLAKLSSVLVWPTSLKSVMNGPVTIHKCLGPVSNRNHSGLAMTHHPRWAVGDGVLFTGDCDYKYLPPSCSTTSGFESVIVTHHGGPVSPTSTIPMPVGSSSYCRLCYSFGAGNTYGHPVRATMTKHHGVGWSATDERNTDNRSTMANGHSSGHIILSPTSTPTGSTRCGLRYCDTGYTQK